MKLLYVVSAVAAYTGLERVLVDKVNWFAGHSGYEVSLVTFEQGNHSLAYPLHPNVSYYDLGVIIRQRYQYSGLKRFLHGNRLHKLFVERLRQAVVEINPDIILCLEKRFVNDIIKARGKVPLVFESHSSCSGGLLGASSLFARLRMQFQDVLSKSSMGKLQYLVALTEGDALEWRKLNSNVAVIPNVVHLNHTGRYSQLSAQKVLFVGRYAAQKDIGSLLRIWQLVHRRHPDWQLDLYGGYGPEENHWLTEVEKMDAGAHAHRSVPDISEQYLQSSMLLLTSVFEPFGLVIPEAMSFGLPVVSFDCPYGPADIISHGGDGFLVKDRNIEKFADYVCRLIEDEQLRKKMGNVAIQSSQRYNADRIMPLWIKLFEEILQNSSKSR